MEVYFLDVGQGTSQLILLGKGSAIVIDGGPKTGNVLAQALQYYHVDRLLRLIVTHSHSDHVDGIEPILTTYVDSIDQIWFLDDPALRRSTFYKRLSRLIEGDEIKSDNLRRIERDDSPRELYSDSTGLIKLKILAPNFSTNLSAIDANNPNRTAAILVLDVGNKRVVFGSDSVIEQWRTIHTELGKPLACDVLAVPHHGGSMGDQNSDLEWLYTQAIHTKHAVVSTGTRNTFGHPRSEVIQTLRQSGAKVLCTQMTDQCCSDLELVRPGLLQPQMQVGNALSILRKNSSGRSQRVACAGTIVVDIDESQARIRSIDSHQSGVQDLASRPHGSPLCFQG